MTDVDASLRHHLDVLREKLACASKIDGFGSGRYTGAPQDPYSALARDGEVFVRVPAGFKGDPFELQRNRFLLGRLRQINPDGSWTKMGEMKITRLMTLQAIYGDGLQAAVERLVVASEADFNACLDAIDGLLNESLVVFTTVKSGRPTKEVMASLTAVGELALFYEMTRVSRKTAHSLLDEMGLGD